MPTSVLKNYVIDLRKSDKIFEGSVNDYDGTYTLVRKVLNIIGVRMTLKDTKFASFCWNAYFWFAYVNVVVAFVLETINMLLTAAGGTFLDLFTMMPCVGYLIVSCTKAYKIKMHKAVFENLVNELREMWPNGRIPEEDYQVVTLALRRVRLLVRAYFSFNMILGSIFIVPVVYVYIKRLLGYDVPLILPFSYWLPFDPFQDVKYLFVTVLILMACHCFQSALFMLAGDLLLIIFLSHVTTQFSLLAVRINKLFYIPIDDQLLDEYPLGGSDVLTSYPLKVVTKTNSCFEEVSQKKSRLSIGEVGKKLQLLKENDPSSVDDKDPEKIIEEELILIILRHRALIRLSGDIENLYTFSLLVNFMNSSVIICFCLFCVAFVEKWNECIYKMFFVTAISQTGILCWYGQRLKDTSIGVADALYNCGWYMTSNKIKKSILIMVHRSQKEVHITAYGFSIISLASYATILKTSWSYFTLLINVYKEKN